ncbi:MAG TPA: MerR family transcriptional regulator [Caulobacteraceae bacterium]|nr:MerR family transcriptional regulator [Caulobacteraceae bacterium]
MTISDAARVCGLTARAVRVYEEQQLIAIRRDAQGVRRFDQTDIARLEFIALCRRAGLPMDLIGTLLRLGEAEGESARSERLLAECRKQIVVLDKQRSDLATLVAHLASSAMLP